MQLYDALFHLAWMVFMIPFLGWTGMKEDWGVETDRGHIGACEKHFSVFAVNTHKNPFIQNISTNLNQNWYSGKEMWMDLAVNWMPPPPPTPKNQARCKSCLIISCYSCSESIHPSLTICTFWLSYTVIALLSDFICLGFVEYRKKAIFVRTLHLTHWAQFHTFWHHFSFLMLFPPKVTKPCCCFTAF